MDGIGYVNSCFNFGVVGVLEFDVLVFMYGKFGVVVVIVWVERFIEFKEELFVDVVG